MKFVSALQQVRTEKSVPLNAEHVLRDASGLIRSAP